MCGSVEDFDGVGNMQAEQQVESLEEQIKQQDFELIFGLTVAAPLGLGPRDIRLVRYLRESAKAVEAYGKGDFKTVKAIAEAPENDNKEFHTFNVVLGINFIRTKNDLGELVARMQKMADNLDQQYHQIAT